MAKILDIFFLSPMAIARLGGSATPLESFTWTHDPDSQGGDMTIIKPAISLKVLKDGSLHAYLPESIRFRDGKSLRPVAPFFELWARVESSQDGRVSERPLTLKLLKKVGASLAHLRYRVIASNRKAECRTHSAACSFTAMVEVGGDDHDRYPLLAYSRHNSGEEPLVYPDHPIPLGHFQVIRPTFAEPMGVDLSTVRVRFTPAQGKVYGPPTAIAAAASPLPPGEAAPTISQAGRVHEIVPPEQRILNPNTPWSRYIMGQELDDPAPSDSYDGANVGENRSWGVVDDTCDALIEAHLNVGGERLVAHARVLVGPPDFAPDRRPFYSTADDLADREILPPSLDTSTGKDGDTTPVSVEEIADLFHRIFETVSLMNLDAVRTRSILENQSRPQPPQFPHLPQIDQRSLTEADKPYVDKSPELLISAAPSIDSVSAAHARIPYTKVAAFVHAPLTDADTLLDFLASYSEHLKRLIRPAFPHFEQLAENVDPNSTPNNQFRDPRILRDTFYDMRMPPYMRDSDENPLSLTRRQYSQLMQLVEHAETLVLTQPKRDQAAKKFQEHK